MALDPILQENYNNVLATKVSNAVGAFLFHRNELQGLFTIIQEAIDNPDTLSAWIAELELKKTAGKTAIQNMLNGIT